MLENIITGIAVLSCAAGVAWLFYDTKRYYDVIAKLEKLEKEGSLAEQEVCPSVEEKE